MIGLVRLPPYRSIRLVSDQVIALIIVSKLLFNGILVHIIDQQSIFSAYIGYIVIYI